MSLDRYRNRNV